MTAFPWPSRGSILTVDKWKAAIFCFMCDGQLLKQFVLTPALGHFDLVATSFVFASRTF